MDRRDFLSAAGAGLAASALPAVHVAAQDKKPLRVGLIGTGWYGKCSIFRLIQVAPVEVVALCDVDKKMLAEAADLIGERTRSDKKPRLHGDYREMLKEKDFDVVMVETPDHWHALPMIAAVQAGADVWVQKPISVDVIEGQAMVAAARKHNKVVQVVTQRRSTPHIVEARDRVIKEDKLGKIGHVEVCCYYHMRANGDPPVKPVPDFFDYEMWTGPAPLRPYDAPMYNTSATSRCRTAAGGGPSTSTATASSATCASTCSTWSASCSAWAGRSGSARPAASTSRRAASRTSPTPRRRRSTSPSSRWSGRTAPGATRPTPSTRGPPSSTATRGRSRSA